MEKVRGEGNGAARLGDEVGAEGEAAHGVEYLFFRDGDDSVHVGHDVLEGPLPAVERTFERIQCDPRHSDVVVLHVLRSDRRDFAEWSMAYAGKLTASGEAARALSEAQRQPGAEGAELVLATLRDLVGREEEWAPG